MRLNRRGLGTGWLGRRIVPAGLLLVTAGAALLWLGSRTPKPSSVDSVGPLAMTTQPSLPPKTPSAKATLSRYAHLPMMFEPNQGQTDPRVSFIARGTGYGLFLTQQEAVLSLQNSGSAKAGQRASVVRMRLAGANESAAVKGTDRLPGKSNYFIGNDPAKWQHNVPQYARVEYSQIYPGIDLVYYGKQGNLEYDFQVAPGADPKSIQLSFAGSRGLKIDAGDLVLATAAGDLRLEAPRVYQNDGAARRPVDGRFVLLADDRVGFAIGAYDRSKTLIIDPVLNYSTYLGGTGTESRPSIAVDSALDMYVAGTTSSTDFPVTDTSTFQSGATANIFVAKFDPTGATLAFATYVGGTGADSSVGVAVDAALNVYVAGTTTSTNFPTSSTAFQGAPNSPGLPHAFVTQLDNLGVLRYSTYLSGSKTDTATGMTLDNKGFVYVIGITNSTDFPLAPVAGTFQSTLQGANAFFISKVAPTSTGANSLNFSTYFGGGFPTTGTMVGGAIAVDNNANVSNIYFTGGTTYIFTGQNSQTDFPIRNAFQPCLGTLPTNPPQTTCPTDVTLPDAFVAKLNPGTTTGAQLLYCTYVGGTATDVGSGIGLDASGNAYITGSTNSTAFPLQTGTQGNTIKGPQQTLGGGADAFVAKINNPATGTGTTNVQFTYFTYIGGSLDDVGNAIVVDNVQGVEVVGTTKSSNLPVANAFQSGLKGSQDAFVARFDTLSTTVNTVSYLGGSGLETGTGIAIDTDSNVYVTGETTSPTDFPTVHPYQGALNGTQPDAFVTKLGPSLSFDVQAVSPASNSVNAGNQIAFNYQIKNTGDTTSNVAFIDNLSGGSGSAPVTFVSASVSGGSCSTTPTDNKVLCNLGTIKSGDTSTVTINLTPTGGGTVGNSGTVSVGSFTTTKAALPIVVNTFRITALKSSNTVVAGNPASYPIQLTPQTNFTASVSISCNAGLPGVGATCSPSTNPVTLQGSSPSTVTLVISTTPRVTTTASSQPNRGFFYASWLPIAGIAFVGLGIGSRLPRGRRVLGGLLFVVVATLILLQPACSGHSNSSTTTGTPAGTYTVTVTASSGSFSQTTPITLVVQ